MTDKAPFHLDKNLIKASFNQAAARYDEAAVLQREVGQRLLERLELIKLTPATILDAGCGTGVTTIPLLRKYRKATVIGLDIAYDMLAVVGRRVPWFRRLYGVCGDVESLPLADASCDLIMSNLTLQWCIELDRALREFQRTLSPGGLLLFTTLGPDTLIELRRSWAAVDGYNHVNAFIDMHDIGDAMMRAGLVEPVMDMEYITLTYKDVFALMRDLKTLGAHNVTAGRAPGLTGKRRLQAMGAAYEQFRRSDGLLPATYEVVYGYGWGPEQRLSSRRGDGAAVFSLGQLRRRRPSA